jgi:hypothetical protein
VKVERREPNPDNFVPALGLGILTPLFDPLVRLLMREGLFKGRLVLHAILDGRDGATQLGHDETA